MPLEEPAATDRGHLLLSPTTFREFDRVHLAVEDWQ